MARARAEGKRIGRPARRIDLAVLEHLRAEGRSIRQIARQIGVPSSTVAKRLKLLAGQTHAASSAGDAGGI